MDYIIGQRIYLEYDGEVGYSPIQEWNIESYKNGLISLEI